MTQHDTVSETRAGEPFPQEPQELTNIASNVAAQTARAVVESTLSGLPHTQRTKQAVARQQPPQQTQPAQQAQQALAQQTQRALAQRQAQPSQQSGQQTQQDLAQQGAGTPSFNQQAMSPQLSAFQQQAERAQTQGQYSPAVDVLESNEEVQIFADLPGVDSDSIDIQASNNTISLSAERIESEREGEYGDPVMAERGRVMQRQIQLPAECNVDEASASWNKGVVTITLPKLESESAKRIGVE